MGVCVSPLVKRYVNKTFDLPCGRCYECKKSRASSWAFRMLQEFKSKETTSAYFVTLTYENAPITKNGLMTLKKRDIQLWLKRLRKANPETTIKYYAVGEYGGKTQRPHYHIIVLNAKMETVGYTWKLHNLQIGHVHIGQVNEATIMYTLKYISKEWKKKHERDDRENQFSLMSKGIGKNYLTPQMIKWHRDDLKNRMFIQLPGGDRIGVPRYYKKKIYTDREREEIGQYLKENAELLTLKQELLTKGEYIKNIHQVRMEKHKRYFKKYNEKNKI